LRDVEGVNGAHAELLVVAGPVVERGECEVIEDQVAIQREAIEPELIPEAYSGHVCTRRLRRSSSALQHLISRRRRHLPLPSNGHSLFFYSVGEQIQIPSLHHNITTQTERGNK